MSDDLFCPVCHTPNPIGSKFCNKCGEPLVQKDAIACAQCGLENAAHLLYCDRCGARLGETPPPPADESKRRATGPLEGFSLPTRPPGDTGDLDVDHIPEWLRTGKLPHLGEPAPVGDDAVSDDAAGDDVDAADPRLAGAEPAEPAAAPETDTVGDWLSDLEDPEETPAWLRTQTGALREPDAPAADDEAAEDDAILPIWLRDQTGVLSGLTPERTGPAAPGDPETTSADAEEETEEAPGPDLRGMTALLSGGKTAAEPTAPEIDDFLADALADEFAVAHEAPGADSPASDAAPGVEKADLTGFTQWLEELHGTEPPPDARVPALDLEALLDDRVGDADTEAEAVPAEAPPDSSAPETTAAPDAEAESDMDDDLPAEEAWLAELREATPEDAPVAADWLEDLRQDTDLASEQLADEQPAGALPAAEIELPELDETVAAWNAPAEDAKDLDDQPELADTGSDWLAALDADTPSAADAVADAADDDQPPALTATDSDWLTSLDDGTPPDDKADAADVDKPPALALTESDWLTSLDDGTPPDAADPDDQPPNLADTGSDWLAALDDDNAADAADVDQPPALATTDSDWLTSLDADTLQDPAERVDESASTDPDGAWLAALDMETPTAADLSRSDEAAGADEIAALDDAIDDALPDWLAEVAAAADSDTPQTTDGTPMPDWLEQILPDEVRSEIAADSDARETPAETGAALPLAELDDWAADEDGGDFISEAWAPADRSSDDDVNVSYDDMPDWLAPEDADNFSNALEAALAVQGEEMMPSMGEDWTSLLASLPPADAIEDEVELEPAAIPDWLEEMRPESGAAAAQVLEPEETSGPLAGLRGVIDIEPIIALPRESQARELMPISKEHKQQAELLRQLAQQELSPPPRVTRARPAALPLWLRWTLAAALLVAILLGLFLGDEVFPVPALPPAPAGAIALQEVVANTRDTTVLVAFDYTPALGGELNVQAELLVEQLAESGNRFVTISQSAAGAALARETIPGATALGYLPGEAIGLRQLSDCLPRLNSCATLAGRALPDVPADIGLVLVVTGERDSLSDWIEQVQIRQEQLPVIAAVTEGLAPVARPYFESEQLAGLLEGLPAAASYAPDSGAADLYRGRALASWLLIALILAGNVLFLTSQAQQHRRARRRIAVAPVAPPPEVS